MTDRELNLVREAVARTRHELGERTAPGSHDWQRQGPAKLSKADIVQIREYVRSLLIR